MAFILGFIFIFIWWQGQALAHNHQNANLVSSIMFYNKCHFEDAQNVYIFMGFDSNQILS